MRRLILLLPVVAAVSIALAGCQQVSEQTGACPTPPPLQPEQRPLPPVANYEQTWQPGHWDWNGTGYTWRAGAWIRREAGATEWMPGYWQRVSSPGPCGWVPAHWIM